MNHEISPSVLRSEILGSFKGVRRLVLVFVVVVGLVGLVYGAEDIPSHTVDVLSFTPPAGPDWETTQKAGSGPMTMSYKGGYNEGCQITVYNSLQSSGDLAADFFSQWKAIIGSAFPEAGYVRDEGASIVGGVSSGPILDPDLNKSVELVTYSAGAKMASIVSVDTSLQSRPDDLIPIGLTGCTRGIAEFSRSVIVNSPASGTPHLDAALAVLPALVGQAQASRTNANPEDSAKAILPNGGLKMSAAAIFGAPAASADLFWVEEWKKQVRMSDLSGEWKNTSTAPGYESTVYTETYVFKGDGTFTSLFQARGSKTVNEEHQGTYALSPRPVIKYVTGAAGTYNILDFEQLPDGSATMNILDSKYPINGINAPNIVYREKLIRAAPKAIPRPN